MVPLILKDRSPPLWIVCNSFLSIALLSAPAPAYLLPPPNRSLLPTPNRSLLPVSISFFDQQMLFLLTLASKQTTEAATISNSVSETATGTGTGTGSFLMGASQSGQNSPSRMDSPSASGQASLSVGQSPSNT